MSCPSGSYTVSTVGAIAASAFENCDSLTSVIIGDSVTSIGDYVVYAGVSVSACGSSVFTNTAVSSVHVVSGYSGSSVCGTGISRDYVAPSGVFSTAAVGVRVGIFVCGVFTYVVV